MFTFATRMRVKMTEIFTLVVIFPEFYLRTLVEAKKASFTGSTTWKKDLSSSVSNFAGGEPLFSMALIMVGIPPPLQKEKPGALH